MQTSPWRAGFLRLREISRAIKTMIDDPTALVAALNTVPPPTLDALAAYYRDRQGLVVDLRKYLLERRRAGQAVTLDELEQRVQAARATAPARFKNYKTLFNIFFPFITSGHGELMAFVEAFVHDVVRQLGLDGQVRTSLVDFQGSRQLGSDRLWFSIYNRRHPHHAGAIQLHAAVHDGSISYGVYRHPGQFFGGPVVRDLGDFDPADLLRVFAEGRELIEQDLASDESTVQEITLGNARLFQLALPPEQSAGQAQEMIALPENAGAEIIERFKNTLQSGDYVYLLQAGENRPLALAQVVSAAWDYLPEELAGPGWVYKNVVYLREALAGAAVLAAPSPLLPTLAELPAERLDELNEQLFEPCFNVRFVGSGVHSQADGTAYISTGAAAFAPDPPPTPTPHNIILYGPPGTGKTYYTRLYALALANNGEATRETLAELYRLRAHDAAEFERLWRRLEAEGRLEFLTFHPNTSYEDFIQGLQPDVRAAELKFFRRDGLFKQLADRARQNWEQAAAYRENLRHYVLIVDEINRGNIARVFGELITLLEPDKRIGRPDAVTVRLPSGEAFALAPNLHLVGTMNTADRSLSQVDLALRRRFEFIGFYPTADTLDALAPELLDPPSRRLLEQLNQAIYRKKRGADFLIGHAYFLRQPGQLDFSREAVLEHRIIPLLLEYFGGRIDDVEEILAATDLAYRFDEVSLQWRLPE